MDLSHITQRAWFHCRLVTIGLLAGLTPGYNADDIATWLDSRPRRVRSAVITVTLALLLAAAVIAAQFGVIGIGLYFLAVILIVR